MHHAQFKRHFRLTSLHLSTQHQVIHEQCKLSSVPTYIETKPISFVTRHSNIALKITIYTLRLSCVHYCVANRRIKFPLNLDALLYLCVWNKGTVICMSQVCVCVRLCSLTFTELKHMGFQTKFLSHALWDTNLINLLFSVCCFKLDWRCSLT